MLGMPNEEEEKEGQKKLFMPLGQASHRFWLQRGDERQSRHPCKLWRELPGSPCTANEEQKKYEWTISRCLKITENVSFNIYVYILSGQKLIKMQKIVHFGEFLKT